MLIRRLARPLLGSIFVASGIGVLQNPAGATGVATNWIERQRSALPDPVSSVIPADPGTLVKVNAASHIVFGSLLSIDKLPRLSAVALGASLIPTTLAGHPFWEESDPQARAMARTQFFKNTGLLGGLLLAVGDEPKGPKKLSRRAQKKADKAAAKEAKAAKKAHRTEAVEAAVVGLGAELGPRLDALAGKSAEFIGTARDRAPEFAELARTRGKAFLDAAQSAAADQADVLNAQAAALSKRAVKARKKAEKRAGKLEEAASRLAEEARKQLA